METQTEQATEKLVEDEAVEEPVTENEVAVVEEDGVSEDNEPLTSEEIRERVVGLSAEAKDAAAALYEEAKDVWLIPVRKGIRSRFNRAKRFFSDLGGE